MALRALSTISFIQHLPELTIQQNSTLWINFLLQALFSVGSSLGFLSVAQPTLPQSLLLAPLHLLTLRQLSVSELCPGIFSAHSIHILLGQSHILTWLQLSSVRANLKCISPAQISFLSPRSCFQMLTCHQQLSVSQAPYKQHAQVNSSDFP